MPAGVGQYLSLRKQVIISWRTGMNSQPGPDGVVPVKGTGSRGKAGDNRADQEWEEALAAAEKGQEMR